MGRLILPLILAALSTSQARAQAQQTAPESDAEHVAVSTDDATDVPVSTETDPADVFLSTAAVPTAQEPAADEDDPDDARRSAAEQQSREKPQEWIGVMEDESDNGDDAEDAIADTASVVKASTAAAASVTPQK